MPTNAAGIPIMDITIHTRLTQFFPFHTPPIKKTNSPVDIKKKARF
jgi:hypothetical protein